ncbi:MAG: type II toxin-antitoxin system VapC family toxin [Bryobacterales bacterium]|nr:type II toxin-antitoxin system VapC family toxin [Bryobacterales bacterium]
MSAFLIDTNVISEFVKPQPNIQVIRWLDDADPNALFVSVITLGEIRLGIEGLPPGRRRSALEQWLDEGLPAWFDANLLPITKSIADRWGRISIEAKRSRSSLSTADGLIAATALEHGLTLVTRNVKDFGGTGLELLNPWSA